MIDAKKIKERLKSRYQNFEEISDRMYKVSEIHDGRIFAIRFFDLTETWQQQLNDLPNYQEQVIAPSYFSDDLPYDLRWNHYLYFIASNDVDDKVFNSAKNILEKNKSYARKRLLREDEFSDIVERPGLVPTSTSIDPAHDWEVKLNEAGLSFIIDEGVKASDAVGRIIEGEKKTTEKRKVSQPYQLTTAEIFATNNHLNAIHVNGYRNHFASRDYRFGKVNLLFGPNGIGKTSLLESIELLFCGANSRDPRRGNTGRSNKNIPDTWVEGKFGEFTLKTFPSQTQTRNEVLHARNLRWYAKVDALKITLCENFGVFNYLNTDAAVKLSMEDNVAGKVKGDIDRLLLGPEVEQLVTLIKKVQSEADKALRERKRVLPEIAKGLNEATTRLKDLRDIPQKSDTIFKDFLYSLKQLGWKHFPNEKSAALQMQEQLSDLVLAEKVLNQFTSGSRKVTLEELNKIRRNLNSELENVELIEITIRQSDDEITRTRPEIEKLQDIESALSELQRYVHVKFIDRIDSLVTLQTNVDLMLVDLHSVSNIKDFDSLKSLDETLTLTQAIRALEVKVTEVTEQYEIAQSNLQNIENSVERASMLREQLVNTGLKLLSLENISHDECPLCLSTLGDNFPISNFELARSRSNDAKVLTSMNSNLESAKSNLNLANNQLFIVHTLSELSVSRDISIKEAISKVKEQKELLEINKGKLTKIKYEFEKLESYGFSQIGYNNLLKKVGLSTLEDALHLNFLVKSNQDVLEHKVRYIDELVYKVKDGRRRLDEISKSFSTSDITILNNLSGYIKSLVSIVDDQINAINLLDNKINRDIDKTAPLSTLLESAQNQLQNLITVDFLEVSNQESILKEELSIESRTASIKKLNCEIDRLQKANELIGEILAQDESSEYSNKILFENASSISEIFSNIHSPKEFEVRLNQSKELIIVRLSTGDTVTLNEMSTGQRAAYALSLFFAMNMRVDSAPPIILLDDPVAHVDDLNILSFLDYLRELVISGDKQIFFATADDKLASLFKQKFQFMHNDFKTIELVRV